MFDVPVELRLDFAGPQSPAGGSLGPLLGTANQAGDTVGAGGSTGSRFGLALPCQMAVSGEFDLSVELEGAVSSGRRLRQSPMAAKIANAGTAGARIRRLLQ